MALETPKEEKGNGGREATRHAQAYAPTHGHMPTGSKKKNEKSGKTGLL